MPGVGSEHLTAAKIYRVGKGAFQRYVQGVFRVSNGVPFSPVGHPGMLGVTSTLSASRAWLPTRCPWVWEPGAPSPAQVAEGLLIHQEFSDL